MYIIEGFNILVKSKDKVLLDVNRVRLNRGEVFAVIGPNGAGKSTLLRVLALLQPPQNGEIYFMGQKVKPPDRIRLRRRMAVVFQEPLLLDATVIENVAVGLRIRGMPAQAARKKAEYWLEKFKVGELRDRWARALSGGEAKRVSLARAFALEPEVLFLDEPFANLDAPLRESLLADFSEVLRTTGVTTFFVSHDLREVALLAGRVMALIEGRPVQEGTPKELIDNPANEDLARFVGVWKKIMPGLF
ncbi:ABC transporter ATP-binding protein [Thermosediminibacter litoriperuensis]|uniref:Tungstate transport system ATP-binding protein n=1 Tax=Thermosediminibacter litoriperuensis TaxID=291989 RepID=A0A5S5AHX9_9FIRM|nr:ATP-binding cassette domain-containing protein [Thermosediminibacter litoriperuensis]TYP49777.1 tungstate transport system ATP-binding protein [Thermosediminibacter litoriperuensis]